LKKKERKKTENENTIKPRERTIQYNNI